MKTALKAIKADITESQNTLIAIAPWVALVLFYIMIGLAFGGW